MNAVHRINAYIENPQLSHRLWVFDEPRFDLKAEAFVGGASEAIDRVLHKKFGKKPNRCVILVSVVPMPDADLAATAQDDPQRQSVLRTGCMYLPDDGSVSLWLCPAICHYFGIVAPTKLYATFHI